MSKVKKPKLEDYLKQSKGQNPFPFNDQTISVVTQTDTTRVVTTTPIVEQPSKG